MQVRGAPFSASVVVYPPISDRLGGEIACSVKGAFEPLEYIWSPSVQHSESGDTAYNVSPGSYVLTVTDANDQSVRLSIEVEPAAVPAVTSYSVVHATSDTARDGTIVATVRDAPLHCKFLWTSGVVTQTPTLHDVRPGTYTATPLLRDSAPVCFVHDCHPAVVLSGREVPTGERRKDA